MVVITIRWYFQDLNSRFDFTFVIVYFFPNMNTIFAAILY
jgi:hypothetical protein